MGPRTCEWHTCTAEGVYPAPSDAHNLQIRIYFCLQHIREYNKSWNYFSHMSTEQVDRYQREALSGHRPTWRSSIRQAFAQEGSIYDYILHQFGFRGVDTATHTSPSQPSLSKAMREAMAQFGFQQPVPLKELKQQYKKLVKRYHPDLNGKDTEEQFKNLHQAYVLLKDSGYFV